MGLLNQTQQEYYEGNSFGNYQFVSLRDIIEQFMVVYVGDDKIIPKARRIDVAFHAQRALAELSFDTLKSCKAQELVVPASLQLALPQDYVNYTKISWVDGSGIKRVMYPVSKTSNPSQAFQNSDNEIVSGIVAIGSQGQTGGTAVNVLNLNDRYDNIQVGMNISGDWGIPPNTTVIDVSLDSTETLTLVTMSADATIMVDEGQTYTFYNSDGSLPKNTSTQFVLTSFTTTAGENYIYDWPIASWDINQVEVGMTVSLAGFPEGTVVTSVNSAPNGTSLTSSDVNYIFLSNTATITATGVDATFTAFDEDSSTWSNYKSATPSENQDDYQDDTYWPLDGERYGLDPQHAQSNGSFYIDCVSGKIHFSSNISGKTVILDYISDSLGTDDEMQVHKFAEEAMYKCIAHAVMSSKANVPEYQVQRFKKERFAAIRTAKLRLSNLKLEELTQILRGKSKQIKH